MWQVVQKYYPRKESFPRINTCLPLFLNLIFYTTECTKSNFLVGIDPVLIVVAAMFMKQKQISPRGLFE